LLIDELLRVATSISSFHGHIFIDGVLVTGAGLKQKVELRTMKLILTGAVMLPSFLFKRKMLLENI